MGKLINNEIKIKNHICDSNGYSKYKLYENEIAKIAIFETETIRNCNNGSPRLTIGIEIKVLEINSSKVKFRL